MAHRIALPDWAVERGRHLNHIEALDPARAALVVIDMQNVFMAPDEVFGNPNAIAIAGTVNAAARAMRDAGGLVVWTRQTVSVEPHLAMPAWQYDRSIPSVARAVETMAAGTRSHALHDLMEHAPADVVIDKYRYGAFSCPAGALPALLAARGIETLVIAGTLTNCCCDSTAREANMAGYRVLFLADATATMTDEEHNAALLCLRISFADVRMTADLLSMLETARASAYRAAQTAA